MIEPLAGCNQKMARTLSRGSGSRAPQASKYDAHNTVLSKTSGADAGLTITNLALATKANIEKIREQALNLE